MTSMQKVLLCKILVIINSICHTNTMKQLQQFTQCAVENVTIHSSANEKIIYLHSSSKLFSPNKAGISCKFGGDILTCLSSQQFKKTPPSQQVIWLRANYVILSQVASTDGIIKRPLPVRRQGGLLLGMDTSLLGSLPA